MSPYLVILQQCKPKENRKSQRKGLTFSTLRLFFIVFLLAKAESTTIHIHSIRLLALEIYKTLHNLNPAFMKDYFLPKPTSYNLRKNDILFVPKVKTTNYGINSVSFLGPKIWNSLPNEIKASRNANQFKILIKDWYFENQCACNACSQ